MNSDGKSRGFGAEGDSGPVPDHEVIRTISGKWKLEILWTLTRGARQFGDLRRALSGLSQGVLLKQLEELQADGLVERTRLETNRRLVFFAATARALGLAPVFNALAHWTRSYARKDSLVMDADLGYADALLPNRTNMMDRSLPSAMQGNKGSRYKS